jgi:tight adherence protein B
MTLLAPLLVAGAATLLALVAAAVLPLVRDLRLTRRARRLLHARDLARAAAATPQTRGSTAAPIMRDGATDDWAAQLEARLPHLRARLDATGLEIPLRRLLALAAAVTAITGVGALLAGAAPLLALTGALAAGALLPWLGLGTLAQRRRAKFAAGMPDAIGLIVRGLKAGLPIADTIVEVGREVSGPVGEEFAGIADELRLGQGLETALWVVARRLKLPALDFFVITLSVQRETGGNLAETLANLDEILRNREAMRLKVKAMSSEAVASAVIIGSLPLVMGALMLVASPGYIDPLFTTSLGHVLLGGAAASMAVGALVMRQMVQFEL